MGADKIWEDPFPELPASHNNEAMTDNDAGCCDFCGKPPRTKPLLKCSRCKQAYYHDATCQKKHYKVHKKVCRPLQEVLVTDSKSATFTVSGNTSGIQVVDSTSRQLGRVTTSTRSFEPGECVFTDRPSIIFDTSNGFFGLWDAFLDSSPATQREILDLQHEQQQNTDSSSKLSSDDDTANQNTDNIRQKLVTKELKRYHAAREDLSSLLPEDLARKLVRIVDLNAHAYNPAGAIHNINEGLDSENTSGTSTNHSTSKTALYVMGSMPEHSCCPNMTSHTNSQGTMEFISEVPIPKNTHVSWSYIPRVLERSRKDRQLQLSSKKHFDCLCRRCLGPDECNPLNCDVCSTNKRPLRGSLFQFCDENCLDDSAKKRGQPNYIWQCVACGWRGRENEDGSSIREQLEQIDALANQMEIVQKQMKNSGQIDPTTLIQCFVLQGQIAKLCHPMHWLHPAVWSIIVSINTAVIKMQFRIDKSKTISPNLVSSLQLSAICQLKRAIWIRRVSSILHGERQAETEDLNQEDNISLRLKNAVQSISDTDFQECQLTPTPDPSIIPSLIQELLVVMNKKASSQPSAIVDHTGMAPLVYYAGLDLLLASRGSTNERLQQKIVAKLLGDFRPLLHRWKLLTTKQREEVDTFLESGGTKNTFTNHYL